MNVNLPHTATDTDSRDRLLSDLRQAVAAEIAATKSRAAVFRAEVWSGKLHTESERNHIYTFLLDTVVPLADDMPGELHVGGKVYPCRIVAVEGLRVSVLLATAPARVIERATLVALPWVALARLHEALGRCEAQRRCEAQSRCEAQGRCASETTAGLGLSTAFFAGESAEMEQIADVAAGQPALSLNEGQQQALATALQRAVTAIAGPTNAGKTHLLSRVAAACLDAGHRVLLLAPSNHAIDSMLGTLVESGASKAYAAGDLLRIGCSADPRVGQEIRSLAPELAESRLRAERERELAALVAERTVLAARDQALRVLQKAVALARHAANERDAVQAEVDSLLAKQENDEPQTIEIAGVQRLRERWSQIWQRAMLLAGRPDRGVRSLYREDSERQRQEAYVRAQQLAEAQRRLEGKVAAAARLQESLDQQLGEYGLGADSVHEACRDSAARLRALAEKHESALRALERVPHAVRARARLVGSTVIQALVDEEFELGSFDVVLIDDAHRIPLPHLYWAAGLARSRLVITLEESALQPWYCAQQTVAQRWLGRSVAAYMVSIGAQSAGWVAKLTERYALHPPLAQAVSGWFAESGDSGKTRLLQATGSPQGQRRSVRRRLPVRGHTMPLEKALADESPLVLVDTSALKPWCEVVPQQGRLNLGSALAAVALAERLLQEKSSTSIALITPYAAQARLLLHVARDREVAGAVGIYAPPCLPDRGADVVILDTVETPGRFAWSALDDSRPESQANAFLSSVCTQARQRVMVLAHWKHVRDSFGTRAILRRMLGEAVQAGWAVSAANLVQSERAGTLPRGSVASSPANGTSDKNPRSQNGWRLLLQDLQGAERHATLWSPQLDPAAVERVLGGLPSELLENGAVRVITLPQEQRGGTSMQSAEALKLCEQIGAAVEERSGLVANLVTVDDRLAWECTFPPLGAGGRGAEMRRVENAHVARILRQLLSSPPADAAQDVAAFMPFTEAAGLMARTVAQSPDRALP